LLLLLDPDLTLVPELLLELLVEEGLTVERLELLEEGVLIVLVRLLFVVEVLLVVDCLVLVPTERLVDVVFL
jgi:hypothetical protein